MTVLSGRLCKGSIKVIVFCTWWCQMEPIGRQPFDLTSLNPLHWLSHWKLWKIVYPSWWCVIQTSGIRNKLKIHYPWSKCSYFITGQALQKLTPHPACHSPFYFITQKVDFDNDWKLVTIFVGTNDLCNYCIDQVGVSLITYAWRTVTKCDMESEVVVLIMCLSQNNLSAKNYSRNLKISLDMLYNQVMLHVYRWHVCGTCVVIHTIVLLYIVCSRCIHFLNVFFCPLCVGAQGNG